VSFIVNLLLILNFASVKINFSNPVPKVQRKMTTAIVVPLFLKLINSYVVPF